MACDPIGSGDLCVFYQKGINGVKPPYWQRRRGGSGLGWPIENGEGLQILNYKVGAEYRPHFDYFSEEGLGSKLHLERGGQRVSTLVVYLSDVEAGGETVFPEIGLVVSQKRDLRSISNTAIDLVKLIPSRSMEARPW